MVDVQEKEKASPINRFLNRISGLGRRSRSPSSKSENKRETDSDADKENAKGRDVHFKIPKVPNKNQDKEKSAHNERSHSPLHRIAQRLSFRTKNKLSDGPHHATSNSTSTSNSSLSEIRAETPEPRCDSHVMHTPRPAQSEGDVRFLHHINLNRGSEGPVTPLPGVTAMSLDNLASATSSPIPLCSDVDGIASKRSPSYLRISVGVHGYSTSPRRAPEVLSNVERLRHFHTVQQRNNDDVPSTPVRSAGCRSNPTGANPDLPVVHTPRSEMGAAVSTPSPIKGLIAKLEAMNLCTSKEDKDVEEAKENIRPQMVINQPMISVVTKVNVEEEEKQEDIEPFRKEVALAKVAEGAEQRASQEAGAREEVAMQVAGGVEPTSVVEEPKSVATIIQVKPIQDKGEKVDALESEMASDQKGGAYFFGILQSKKNELEAEIGKALGELSSVEALPEGAADAIRMAAGKAQLLLRKKLAKFSELVEKNLKPVENDPQPVTTDDLVGYWAMVEIELCDIDTHFREVETWRQSGWKEGPEQKEVEPPKSIPTAARRTTPAVVRPVTQANPEKLKAEQARRRQMIKEAREKTKQQQANNNPKQEGLMVL